MVRQACSGWESDMAGEVPKDRRPVVEALERMWAQAVTAMSSVEDEAARVVQRAQTVAGWSQDEVRRQMSDLAERLAAQRRELEQGLEERVRGALQRLRVPKREEVQALTARVERVAERLEKLERGG
jgi:polyhydroxyalkanoate synthesis regulator phasin